MLGRRPLLGYGVCALAIIAATANALWLHSSAQVASYMTAVIVTAWFGGTWPGVLAMALSIPGLLYVLPPGLSWQVDPGEIPRLGYFLLLSSFVLWILASERKASAQLRHLSRRLLEVQENERRHLARELHDQFGQILTGVNLHLHTARNAVGGGGPAQSNLDQSIALVERASEQVRFLVLELRPVMLEAAGLDRTLHWLAAQHRKQTGVATEVVGQAGDVPLELATACFRVAQEALTNVARHAHARHAWIELKRANGALHLAVRDDGPGFDVKDVFERSAARGHVGLLGMRERVQILGGKLEIDSRRPSGTRIDATFPAQ